MLCEKCKKKEAKINLVKVVNGHKEEIWLCEECAKNLNSIPMLNSITDSIEFPFQEMISGILSSVKKGPDSSEKKRICDVCGLSEEEFSKDNKLGCSNCYKVFNSSIKEQIKNEGIKEFSYVGRIPNANEIEFKQRDRLKTLKLKLQELIKEEKYEEASSVSSEIKQIELDIVKKYEVEHKLGGESY